MREGGREGRRRDVNVTSNVELRNNARLLLNVELRNNARLLLNVELRNYVISRQIIERQVTQLPNITSDCYLNIGLDCY